MKRPIALVVLVAFLMQLSACSSLYAYNPTDLEELEQETIRAILTGAGEEMSWDSFTIARVYDDTLLTYIDGEPYKIAIAEIDSVWIEQKDPDKTKNLLLGLAAAVGLILVIKSIKKATRNMFVMG